MQRLEVENLTQGEFQQHVERSVTRAVETGHCAMRQTIERFVKTAYLHKDWLTLKEAARYADITTAMFRDWRDSGLAEAEVEGRIYIEREAPDNVIASCVGDICHHL